LEAARVRPAELMAGPGVVEMAENRPICTIFWPTFTIGGGIDYRTHMRRRAQLCWKRGWTWDVSSQAGHAGEVRRRVVRGVGRLPELFDNRI